MNDIAINLENVSKFYKLYDSPKDRLKEALSPFGKAYHKKFYALKNINLTVKKGELLGIVGKNGCGKSTLLKIIASVLKTDSGNVTVRGKVSALLELGSGFNPEFTGLQNIYFYGAILGLHRAQIDSILQDIISFADIGEYINQPLKTYSSGMKARLGFSVATAIKPEILILDEVLSVGDAQFRKKSSARMQEMMNSGCTVLLVSHSEDSINRLCSRAVYIREGEIVVSGIPKNITKLYLKVLGSNSYISNNEIQTEHDNLNNEDGHHAKKEGLNEARKDGAFFSESVKKLSQPVFLNNAPIEMIEAEIINEDHEHVNVLDHGMSYKLVLKYYFSEAVKNIVLPIGIYTSEGQLLFGIRNPGNNERLDLNADTELKVSYDFRCLFLTGTYYISTGVTQLRGAGEEKNFLLRADDVISFKVQDHSEIEHWGVFSSVVGNMTHEFNTSARKE